jgi:hypothetical protein
MKSEIKMQKSNGKFQDSDENIHLCNCIFGESYRRELKDMNEHEIIVKIAGMLGKSPCELGKAERIFNSMKYVITNHIIHHEYDSNSGISMDLLTWLDSQADPGKSKKLNRFLTKFLK